MTAILSEPTSLPLFEARAAWIVAFLASQADFPPITKTRTATIKTKSGSEFSYSYADLPDILAAVQPVLMANGLGIAQSVVGELADLAVETRIYHKDGWVETFGPIHLPGGEDARAAGSAVTYARRYALCAALGIAPDEDDDGEAASVRRAREDRPEPETPKSTDDPHCPACLRELGVLVAVTRGDKKPYWRCTASPEECGGPRTWSGKQYSWAGWHESFENSVADWAGTPVTGEPKVVDVTPSQDRGNYHDHILSEVMALSGITDQIEAQALIKPGLLAALGEIDVVDALGGPASSPPTDDELRAIYPNLTPLEAELVIAAAVQVANEAPFE